jgi:hemerythrin
MTNCLKGSQLQKDFDAGKITFHAGGHILKGWLTNHIQGSDKKYVPFLANKGVK